MKFRDFLKAEVQNFPTLWPRLELISMHFEFLKLDGYGTYDAEHLLEIIEEYKGDNTFDVFKLRKINLSEPLKCILRNEKKLVVKLFTGAALKYSEVSDPMVHTDCIVLLCKMVILCNLLGDVN